LSGLVHPYRSRKSGAALLELLRPVCGTMVGTLIPPDVRLAGKPATIGALPWTGRAVDR
jgi:hypothetical protein